MMKKKLLLLKLQLLCITMVTSGYSFGQGQNGIDFDGVDDYISVPNGSSMIAGSNTISMTLWVYPENSTAGWPDFDGFSGFRNNTNADFYIMQLGSTDVEARFRNSFGATYDIAYSGLILNSWNHFALTYDGTTLSLYHNGTLAGSITASGNITNTSTSFDMGYLLFSTLGDSFYLDGKLDRVALWNSTLSASEVTALYNASCGYDMADPNIVLAYEFDQGIANDDNTSIPSLTDGKGNIDGVFYNLALNNTSSNFVQGVEGNSYAFLSELACLSYTVPSGNATYTTDGTYMDTIPNVAGCDSIIIIDLTIGQTTTNITEVACLSYDSPAGNTYTISGTYTDTLTSVSTGCDSIINIDLTVNTVDTSVSVFSDYILEANENIASYQWIDCGANTVVSGETNQSFTATNNGDYAVIVTTIEGCSDTSSCYTLVPASNSIEETLFNKFKLYPNPTSDIFTIDFRSTQQNLTIKITNMLGQVIHFEEHVEIDNTVISIKDQADGIYLVRITIADRSEVFQLVKDSSN